MLMMVGGFIINSNCGIRCIYRACGEVKIGLSPDGDVSGCGGGTQVFRNGAAAPRYSAGRKSGNRTTDRGTDRRAARELSIGEAAGRAGTAASAGRAAET